MGAQGGAGRGAAQIRPTDRMTRRATTRLLRAGGDRDREADGSEIAAWGCRQPSRSETPVWTSASRGWGDVLTEQQLQCLGMGHPPTSRSSSPIYRALADAGIAVRAVGRAGGRVS